MLIVAFDIEGVAFWELMEENETVTGERYRKFLMDNIKPWMQKRRMRVPLILQDNARPYKSNAVMEYIREMGWEVLPHPPYSPDMSPPDYDEIDKIKDQSRGKRFSTRDEMRGVIESTIESLNLDREFHGVQKLPQVWEKVINNEGQYD
jgi:hypothetical protein